MIKRATFLLVLGATAALLTGCGPSKATVSGEVKMDGQPLDSGVISFAPAAGGGASATADVKNGKYSVQTTPGAKWVQISAPLVIGQRKLSAGPDARVTDIREERLPERYNAKTELKCDLKAGGNVKDWSVESKKHMAGGK